MKAKLNTKLIKLCLLLILIIILPGCWDRLELEDQAYVVAIGLDSAEDGNIAVTCQIANPQGGGSAGTGKSENEAAYEIVTFVMKDFLSIRDLATASVTRKFTFSHTKTLIVSEELAKSDKFYNLINAAVRDRQVRRDTFLIVSREKAADFIRNNQPKLETRPHKFYEFMSRRWRETGLVPLSIIRRFILRTKGGNGLFLAIYGTTEKVGEVENKTEDEYIAGEIDKEGGNAVELIGSAVFKDGKMIGVLNGEETRIAMILREEISLPSILATFPDPLDENYLITARLAKHQGAKIDINTDVAIPRINVDVTLQMSVISIPSQIDYINNTENRLLLESYIEEKLNEKASRLVERTQKEFGIDAFVWYLDARKEFLTLNEYESYKWREKYPDADVTVKYDIHITDFGRLFEPIGINMHGEKQ